MQYWLMKSEPSCFSIDDLIRSPEQTYYWDGVRNYQARNFMRDNMQIGDQVFFYHSNCKPPGIVGIAEVATNAYPDFTAFDPEHKHYDPSSTVDKPRWFMVDVHFVKKFPKIIPLDTLKQFHELAQMRLLQKGNRLSILPINKSEWDFIIDLAHS